MHVGAEYRSFLLYWGPVVLKGILTDDRYFHFLLLSSAITLFLGLSIPEDDVQLGEEMITTYLTMYPGLYGKSLVLEAKVTIESGGGEKRERKKIIDFEKRKKKGQRWMAKTTHTLIHLGEHVRKFGPLWTASCFPFESFYHYTVKRIHGTRYALHQVSQFPSPLLERTPDFSHFLF